MIISYKFDIFGYNLDKDRYFLIKQPIMGKQTQISPWKTEDKEVINYIENKKSKLEKIFGFKPSLQQFWHWIIRNQDDFSQLAKDNKDDT